MYRCITSDMLKIQMAPLKEYAPCILCTNAKNLIIFYWVRLPDSLSTSTHIYPVCVLGKIGQLLNLIQKYMQIYIAVDFR